MLKDKLHVVLTMKRNEFDIWKYFYLPTPFNFKAGSTGNDVE